MPSSLHIRSPVSRINTDSLPPYTTADPETSSVHSSAPSYTSETPTYHSTVPPAHVCVESGPSLRSSQLSDPQSNASSQTEGPPCSRPGPEASQGAPPPPIPPSRRPPQRLGLPPVTYAPGFKRRVQQTSSSSNPSILNLNVNELRSIYTGPKAQVYRNITARRARKVTGEERYGFVTLVPASGPSPPPSPSTDSSSRRPLSDHPNPAQSVVGNTGTSIDSEPVSPYEDPELVGVEAAKLARERRIYLAKCVEDREALKTESLSWDFMLGQMTDWKARERNWQRFQGEVQRTRMTSGWMKRRR